MVTFFHRKPRLSAEDRLLPPCVVGIGCAVKVRVSEVSLTSEKHGQKLAPWRGLFRGAIGTLVSIENSSQFSARALLQPRDAQSLTVAPVGSPDTPSKRPFTATTLLRAQQSTTDMRLPPRTGVQPRAPRFLVPPDRAFLSRWDSLRALLGPRRLCLYTSPVCLFRDTPVATFRFAGKAVTLSILLHIAGCLWLPYLPSGNARRARPASTAFAEPGKIYYRLTVMDLSRRPPRIAPEGPGGHPGVVSLPTPLPPPAVTDSRPKFTIVLRPPRPDNRKQAILQNVAPDLRINIDQKVPNLILQAAAAPKPKIRFTPNSSKPMNARKSVVSEAAPTLLSSTDAAIVPVAGLANPEARLPVPPPAPAAVTQAQDAVPIADGALAIGKEGNGLVILGADSAQAAALLTLPAGSRWSELLVSPVDNPRGVPDNSGGNPKPASDGGDASAGIGRLDKGGGAKSGAVGVLSVTGSTADASSLSDSVLPQNMVFAIPASVFPRRNALIVSAGPMGGGGLDIYGALRCGKIYTIFIQMPGPNWTLQFCQAGHQPVTEARNPSVTVRLEQGLLPPEVELRFDFRRLPLPQAPAPVHKLILLKGVIRADGSVDQVQVYRGVLPQMDEAARIAFSRWKFKPAMRENRSVDVEFLLGIPSDTPVSRSH
jgi:hypothetical protein